jgi:hypothetical protein
MHSNTKLFTSVAAMTLWEAGCFGPDDPLAVHLPQVADLPVLRPDARSGAHLESRTSPCAYGTFSHPAGLSHGFAEPDSLSDQLYLAAGVTPFKAGGIGVTGHG